MPVEFRTDEQAAPFGRFGDDLPREVLERRCRLDDADHSLVDIPDPSTTPAAPAN